ncbi:hypothetical protein O9H85_03890 [Paenibacillus filicis]|uniref:Uncharacterized protein n=1 Tax=Paenibacillus gyeongsangnamensis TaxID=3388067 RepID=A0ABT4Q447_9BACL|nr:hypothetical protein [Paenibacillus filicis]MCZ8511588.1 hypothetical protein [Paenibacillus filicis]
MTKKLKMMLAATLLTAIALPASVSAKPEAKPAAFSAKAGSIFAAKPEAKPEM